MSESVWYHSHFESTGWIQGVDSEQLALELFEELAAGAPNGTDRVQKLLSACMSMPWNAHLGEVMGGYQLENHLDMQSNRVQTETILSALCRTGLGANPMPFPCPEINPCRILHRQLVFTARGEHTLDHVLVGNDGRGYGFVRNLQNCIYGKVRHGIELERNTSMQRQQSSKRSFGGLFSSGGLGLTADESPNQHWRATGVQVAIKCIERSKYEAHVERHRGRLNEDPIKEIAVMQHVKCGGGAPYVLNMLGCYADANTIYVVLPFCPHGDLFGLVEEHGGLPELTAFSYFQQIIKGLQTLHQLGLAHHDMSLENLMLDEQRSAVIIDFGMTVKTQPTPISFLVPHRASARTMHSQDTSFQPPIKAANGMNLENFNSSNCIVDKNYFSVPLRPSRGWPCRCGKLLYMAPELYEPTEPFDVYAADVWALGIILFLLLTGMPPWDAATGPASTDLRYCYVRDGRLSELLRTWNVSLSEQATNLLQRLLDANPKTRITIPELKNHPWWTSLVPSTN
mmetsp:Transcript_21736/g.33389  ORF Transcript_21736/g.33389 Transcript_21736/m.33389 type:complete len:513 (-) Transcript_21736:474-2012(-)